ncbi:sulfotransferase family 2 domain-containing protein [Haloferula sp. BvORR071]|uniref:sulfotransferase family 2 domain-containing protein n=1 Tax=Haloferula sp. BvORR071 TaxID=1396141 RepID=UPI002240F49F|nr:sulfotransferase family 2 domain-containing protein [Haloferula sp. BvORR071]
MFLHIPKSGGSSIREALKQAFSDSPQPVEGWGLKEGVDLAHPLPSSLRDHFPRAWNLLASDHATSIAVVRDPVSRFVSAFREHRKQYGRDAEASANEHEYLERLMNGEFKVNTPHSHIYIHGAPQRDFIFDGDRLLPRLLFRLDDPLLFEKISLAVGRSIRALEENRSSSRKHAYLDRALLKGILQFYEADFELMDSLGTATH